MLACTLRRAGQTAKLLDPETRVCLIQVTSKPAGCMCGNAGQVL